MLYITAGSQKGSKGGVYYPLPRRHKKQTQITISQQFQQTQYTNPAPEHVNLKSKSKMDKTQTTEDLKIQYLLHSACFICWCCSNLAKCYVNDGVTDAVTSCKLFWAFHQSAAEQADPLNCQRLLGIDRTTRCSRCPSSHPLNHLSAGWGREMNP